MLILLIFIVLVGFVKWNKVESNEDFLVFVWFIILIWNYEECKI